MLPWIFLACGVGGLGFVLANLLLYATLRRRGVATRGRVTDAVDTDGEGTMSLVVAFADRAGRIHRIASRGAASHWGRKVGGEVTVVYDPARPERGRIAEDVRMQTWVGVLLGLIFTGVALAKLLG